MIPHFEPIHPKDFRAKHKLSVAQIAILSGIPIDTLKGWFSKEESRRVRKPPIGIENYFGLLDSLMCASERIPAPRGVLTSEHLVGELELTIKFQEQIRAVELSRVRWN